MLLMTDREKEISSSEITPRATYEAFQMNRRTLMAGLGAVGVAAALPRQARAEVKIDGLVATPYAVPDRATTPVEKARNYNNFYEFGEDKGDPAKNAYKLRTYPWNVSVEGLVAKPRTFQFGELFHLQPMQQRVYRFRCVEAWSMVIPWDGFPLSELIKVVEPLPKAKFVQFISVENSKEEILPSGIPWPYSEGLRMDEAMNPLTLLTFGAYGETLANQQGAPVRVIVPWKYGFKSAKSIVKIKFVEKMPSTTWNELAADEYGFYSNVNPTVDHPRWSQAHERLLNTNSIFPKVVPTLMFNGYGDQVASMYAGMDLRKNF
jgi:sulfoxide reductase catalytic subunit YedY